MSESKSVIDTGVTETTVQEDYFALRQLKKGAVGWLLLVGLGVAYVISGDFAGWNFGLAQAGWGGMFIATVVVALMYLCMCVWPCRKCRPCCRLQAVVTVLPVPLLVPLAAI